MLGWDEPAWPHLAHLAEGPPAGFEAATVEQLLTHTAGLRMSVGLAGAVEVHDGPDALDRRARDLLSGRLASAPGTRWEYSNAGPTLLAAVIEQVTGRSFGEELRDRVLGPLGMTGSFATAEAAAAAPMATGQELWFGRWRPVDHPYDEAGAAMGYIGSTARDLAAFMQAHLDGHPAIPTRASQLAGGPVHATGWDVPLEGGYGRGWFVDEFAGHAVISHTGSLGQFSAHILLVPGADDLGLDLVRILLGEEPRPASGGFMLSYLAPALAWAACGLVTAFIVWALLDVRKAPRRRPRTSRRSRRLAVALALLAAGVALLAAPLDTARHFYPGAGWGLSLLAPLSLGAGVLAGLRSAYRPSRCHVPGVTSAVGARTGGCGGTAPRTPGRHAGPGRRGGWPPP